mmetsp:Transcript_174827/g.425356  ORF Transcript_174827/g.425356 Transcript_174827/m.425356 type:complete len:371 (-) Transcript_174827:716-1828(-)
MARRQGDCYALCLGAPTRNHHRHVGPLGLRRHAAARGGQCPGARREGHPALRHPGGGAGAALHRRLRLRPGTAAQRRPAAALRGAHRGASGWGHHARVATDATALRALRGLRRAARGRRGPRGDGGALLAERGLCGGAAGRARGSSGAARRGGFPLWHVRWALFAEAAARVGAGALGLLRGGAPAALGGGGRGGGRRGGAARGARGEGAAGRARRRGPLRGGGEALPRGAGVRLPGPGARRLGALVAAGGGGGAGRAGRRPRGEGAAGAPVLRARQEREPARGLHGAGGALRLRARHARFQRGLGLGSAAGGLAPPPHCKGGRHAESVPDRERMLPRGSKCCIGTARWRLRGCLRRALSTRRQQIAYPPR